MSMIREDWLRAHAALWYGDAGYRLTWLAMPQAVTCAVAGLCLALAAQGGWGRPATTSKARVAELSALRDRAGKAGDRKAFDDLTAAATRGEIDASTKLGTLYDPLVATYFSKKPSPDNFGRAAALYSPGAAAGDLTAVARLADVLLDPANPNRDLRHGCRLAQTWIEDPETLQRTITGEERLTVKLATSYVEPGSGLPQDPVRAGGLVTAVLWRRHQPTIDAFVNNLGQQNPALVSGLQQNLAKQGRYIGPVDGRANPGIVTALQVEAGITNTVVAPRPEPRRMEPKGPDPEVMALQAAAQAGDRGKMAALKSRADAGNADALTAYARLFNPVFNKGAVFAPDAQVAVASYERAAAAGNGMAASEAAVIYDAGWGNVGKDPRKAAILMLRGVDLKDSQSEFWLLFEEAGSWSGPFWGALQAELTARGFYTLPVENKRNPAVITALRAYIKARS